MSDGYSFIDDEPSVSRSDPTDSLSVAMAGLTADRVAPAGRPDGAAAPTASVPRELSTAPSLGSGESYGGGFEGEGGAGTLVDLGPPPRIARGGG